MNQIIKMEPRNLIFLYDSSFNKNTNFILGNCCGKIHELFTSEQ